MPRFSTVAAAMAYLDGMIESQGRPTASTGDGARFMRWRIRRSRMRMRGGMIMAPSFQARRSLQGPDSRQAAELR